MSWSKQRRRWLIPEIIQTSGMDCGPAALASLAQGYRIPVSYGRLREMCHTDVDGTSIDTLEETAVSLGLDAEQVMVPADHLFLPEAYCLPAIIVVRLPGGLSHFLVAWRRHGGWIQVMDPGTGRRWHSIADFQRELYLHRHPVSASGFRSWAETESFTGPLIVRARHLGISTDRAKQLITNSLNQPGWQPVAALDASVRLVSSIIRSGGLRRGKAATCLVEQLVNETASGLAPTLKKGVTPDAAPEPTIPASYWSVVSLQAQRPKRSDDDSTAESDPNTLLFRGAVLVRALGMSTGNHRENRNSSPATNTSAAGTASVARGTDPVETSISAAPLSQREVALGSVLRSVSPRPLVEAWKIMRADGVLTPTIVGAGLLLAAAVVVGQAVLFRALFHVSDEFVLTSQRAGALGLLLVFLLGLLLLELPLRRTVLGMGRHLETRLRIALSKKIPRLADRYFRSRLTSDTAERGHAIHRVRMLPQLGANLVQHGAQLMLTSAGIIWLDPRTMPLILVAMIVSVGLPLLAHPVLAEHDLRLRTHSGALTRFYLDGLLGLTPIRTHGAGTSMSRAHESLLTDWFRTGLSRQRAVVAADTAVMLTGFLLAAWILSSHLGRGTSGGGMLLLVYWALNIPALGQALALSARQYPMQRSTLLRVLDPLMSPETTVSSEPADTMRTGPERSTDTVPDSASRKSPQCAPSHGLAVYMRDVTVRAAGNPLLSGINLEIKPGSHVAIVGPSGAGKSTFLGLLLGWHLPAIGRIEIEGFQLSEAHQHLIRRQTVWVDPAVQLWNRGLADNLLYGVKSENPFLLGRAIEDVELWPLIERLPYGMQSRLGEGGALVSGGEGQRVRLGRAFTRTSARLALLDEPFRGLDRTCRARLLRRAREYWSSATLLCVTHDISEALSFPRVLVIDKGRIIQDGEPRILLDEPGSRLATLRKADLAAREVWNEHNWQRIWLEDGCISRDGPTSGKAGVAESTGAGINDSTSESKLTDADRGSS